MDDRSLTTFLSRRRCVGAAGSALFVAACGGAGGDDPKRPATLRFSNVATTVAPGTQMLLRLWAEDTAGQAVEVTVQARWQSSQPAVVKVIDSNSPGIAGTLTALSDGRADIVATYQGATATLSFTVGNGLFVDFELIHLPDRAVGRGGQYRFGCLVHYTTDTLQNDPSLTWVSSAPDVVTVSNEAGVQGTVTGRQPGKATITASKAGVSHSASMEVLDIRCLAMRPYGSAGPTPNGRAQVCIDGAGRSLAVFSFLPDGGPVGPGLLFATRPAGGGPWSAPASVPNANMLGASGAWMVTNEAGQALVLWQRGLEVLAARYTPSTGMSAAQSIASGGTATPVVAMAGDGSALAAWAVLVPAAELKYGIVFSRLDAATGQWSAPAPVPGATLDRGDAQPSSLALNEAGQGVLTWARARPFVATAEAGDETINALMVSRFEPGAGGGWQSPEQVSEVVPVGGASAYFSYGGTAIGASGHITVAWIQDATVGAMPPFLSHVRARQYRPGVGWGNLQPVVSATSLSPRDLRVAVNDSGAAVLAWVSAWDNGLWVSTFSADGIPASPGNLFTPSEALASGTPTTLQLVAMPDGRMLAAWGVELAGHYGNVMLARYAPSSGWGTPTVASFVGRHFPPAEGIQLRFNRAGQGVGVWSEGRGEGACLYTSDGFQV